MPKQNKSDGFRLVAGGATSLLAFAEISAQEKPAELVSLPPGSVAGARLEFSPRNIGSRWSIINELETELRERAKVEGGKRAVQPLGRLKISELRRALAHGESIPVDAMRWLLTALLEIEQGGDAEAALELKQKNAGRPRTYSYDPGKPSREELAAAVFDAAQKGHPRRDHHATRKKEKTIAKRSAFEVVAAAQGVTPSEARTAWNQCGSTYKALLKKAAPPKL